VVAVFAIHAQAAFASLLEPSYSADNSTLFWGVIFAAVVVSLLHFVHTLNKVFLFFGAAVFWGAIALSGTDLSIAALFPEAAGMRPHPLLLATPLALWFGIRLALGLFIYPNVSVGVQHWLLQASTANVLIAISARWFSASHGLLPFSNGAVFLLLTTVITYRLVKTPDYKKALKRLLLDLPLIGLTLTFLNMFSPSMWTEAEAIFGSVALYTLFLLADEQRSLALSAYREQLVKTQNQDNALQQCKLAENDLEAKFSQRTHELHLAVQRLQTLSAQDGLTGVANRHRFDEVLKVEYGRAARSRQALSVALIDVDCFMSFNSRYGHELGDACLCQLARVLESGVMRNGDLIARYNGGAFVLLAPDTDSSGILSIANYLCQEVYGLDLPNQDSPFGRVSISIGVATAHPQDNEGPERLVQRASEGLASAKLQGRHRVVTG